jgi:uncharacterized membrane protein
MAVERVVSRILWWGGVANLALMLIGLVGHAVQVGVGTDSVEIMRGVVTQGTAAPPHLFTSVGQVVAGLRHRPVDLLAVAAVGLLALLATPVAAVVAAIPVYLSTGDRRYALISTFLAVALIGSLLVGGAG